MTQNQLSYLNLEETKRNNVVVSTENNRHNLAVEGETNRHNLVTEAQTDTQNAETKRHNLVTEGQGAKSIAQNAKALSETKRHNKATERLSKYKTDKDAKTSVKIANTGAAATKEAARTNAEASKYSADKSSEASKYGSDVSAKTQKRIASLNAGITKWKTLKDNASAKEIAESQNQVAKYKVKIDMLMKDKEIDARTKTELKKIDAQLKIAKDSNDVSMINSAMNNATKIWTSAIGMFG